MGGIDWMDLAQDRDRWRAVVNAVMNLLVSWNAGKFLSSWEPVSFSGRTLIHWVKTCVRYFRVPLKTGFSVSRSSIRLPCSTGVLLQLCGYQKIFPATVGSRDSSSSQRIFEMSSVSPRSGMVIVCLYSNYKLFRQWHHYRFHANCSHKLFLFVFLIKYTTFEVLAAVFMLNKFCVEW